MIETVSGITVCFFFFVFDSHADCRPLHKDSLRAPLDRNTATNSQWTVAHRTM